MNFNGFGPQERPMTPQDRHKTVPRPPQALPRRLQVAPRSPKRFHLSPQIKVSQLCSMLVIFVIEKTFERYSNSVHSLQYSFFLMWKTLSTLIQTYNKLYNERYKLFALRESRRGTWRLRGMEARKLGGSDMLILETSWTLLMDSWGLAKIISMTKMRSIEHNWETLIWGERWNLLGPLGGFLGPLAGVLGGLGAVLGPSCGGLGASWGVPGSPNHTNSLVFIDVSWTSNFLKKITVGRVS